MASDIWTRWRGARGRTPLWPLLALCLLASRISAQQTFTEELRSAYEGQTVSTVELAGRPDIAAASVRQRVTGKLFVTFSADTTSSSLNQVVQVRYQLNPRWSIAADVDQNGGFGFEARVHKDY